MENYEKKYKDALERAKKIVNDQNASSVWKGWLCNCFPELKESEDDIREDCIAYIDGMLEAAIEKNDKEEIVELRKILAWLEKQGEQKPADKVEPKFHEGDWVVDNCGYVWKIEGILNQFYILESVEGGESRPTIEWVDKTFHLWSIADAKDGDILATDKGSVFIYAKILYNKPYAYCGVNKFGVFKDNCLENNWTNSLDNIMPATKEQCNLLFKKMTDAEYTFNFEKKELKKIKNEIEIPFSAKDSELQEVTYHIPKGFHAEIERDKVVIKKGEQKPIEWNVEDSIRLQRIIDFLWHNRKGDTDGIYQQEQDIDWLKSLKSRKLCVYNPYKAVVESIAKMCDKYENCMCDENEAKDFLANVAIKCREAAEYDKNYSKKSFISYENNRING